MTTASESRDVLYKAITCYQHKQKRRPATGFKIATVVTFDIESNNDNRPPQTSPAHRSHQASSATLGLLTACLSMRRIVQQPAAHYPLSTFDRLQKSTISNDDPGYRCGSCTFVLPTTCMCRVHGGGKYPLPRLSKKGSTSLSICSFIPIVRSTLVLVDQTCRVLRRRCCHRLAVVSRERSHSTPCRAKMLLMLSIFGQQLLRTVVIPSHSASILANSSAFTALKTLFPTMLQRLH